PADDPPGANEPRPRDGGRAAQEDRHRQPVHGLRRARHRCPRGRGGEDRGRGQGPRRLRPDDRRAALIVRRRYRRLVPRHELRRRGYEGVPSVTDIDRPRTLDPGWEAEVAASSDAALSLTHQLFRFPAKTYPPAARAMISRYTKAGETVADPFSGSGTIPLEAI